MSEPYKLPLPKHCIYSMIETDSGHTHFCHVQWVDPADNVPWNCTVEWYGPRCSVAQMHGQGYLKLLRFINMERQKDAVETPPETAQDQAVIVANELIYLPPVAVIKEQTDKSVTLVYSGPVTPSGQVEDIDSSEFNLVGHGWHYPHVMLRRALREANPDLSSRFIMHKDGESEIRLTISTRP